MLPEMPAVDGVRFATAEAGIRYKGRTDLSLAVLDPGTTVAGVLTRSKTCSAPVEWCAQALHDGRARALVVNSGNANAFTGKKGREAVEITAEAAAKAVGCLPARSSSPRPASSASRWMQASSRTYSAGSPAKPPRMLGMPRRTRS